MKLSLASRALATLLMIPSNSSGFVQTSFRKSLNRVTSERYRPEPLRVDTSESFTGTELENGAASEDEDLVPILIDEHDKDLKDVRDHISLPRHSSNEEVNDIISATESTLRFLNMQSISLQDDLEKGQIVKEEQILSTEDDNSACVVDPTDTSTGRVYANSYVDLGRVDTVGFDYDYTLVTYSNELLELIYDMALKRLVNDKQYPLEMLEVGMKFDPKYSIRGLAVDRQTAWICHLSYTHKVAVAWEGREKVSRARLMEEYTGKRALLPDQRKKRLKPLNDLFSMAECCLIADTVEYFKKRNIPFSARNAVDDILSAIGSTHISGDFHRLVAENPEKYFEPRPALKGVLEKLKKSGKRLIFVSNSPFWYVDAGMKYMLGEQWRNTWDAVVVSAGKPNFYTDDSRPFREVSTSTGRIKFKKIERFEPGEVYTEGCLRELTKCIDWRVVPNDDNLSDFSLTAEGAGGGSLTSPNVLYIGDSLFADLVDAKRQFGWTTAAVTPEVEWELGTQSKTEFILAQQTISLLLNSLRLIQRQLGSGERNKDDLALLDSMEKLISKWRDEQANLLENPFGSVFRARHQPSLFAHSLRRYCDLYMPDVAALGNYSPQHRFYPYDAKLLSHELRNSEMECWDLETLLSYDLEGRIS